MAHYTQDCVEMRDRPPDPRDATIAQLEADVRALVEHSKAEIAFRYYPDEGQDFDVLLLKCHETTTAVLPIITRYQAAQEASSDE